MDTKVIYVVGFAPDFTGWHGDTARVGGFDWRTRWADAAEIMRGHLNDGESGHDYVFRSVQVPRDLDGDAITEWLNGEGFSLWNVPIPDSWVSLENYAERVRDEPPFKNAAEVGAFIRAHMTGSSFMASHDGIGASTVQHGDESYYRVTRDGRTWRYDHDVYGNGDKITEVHDG